VTNGSGLDAGTGGCRSTPNSLRRETVTRMTSLPEAKIRSDETKVAIVLYLGKMECIFCKAKLICLDFGVWGAPGSGDRMGGVLPG